MDSAYQQLFDDALQAYHRQDHASAEQSFLKLTEAAPHLSEGFLNLGNVYFKTSRHAEAEASWKKAIELDPMEAMAYLNLGNLYFQNQQLEEAVGHWEIFKKMQRNHANVFLNLGIAYDQLGQPARAMENYGVFIGLKPTSPEANKIKMRYDNGRKMLETNTTAADHYLGAGDARKALAIYRQALASYPGSVKHYKTFAGLLYQAGEYAEAIRAYQFAYERNPDDVAVLTNMGVSFERLNRPVDAMWAYTRALDLNTPDKAKVNQRLQALFSRERSSLAGYLEEAKGCCRRGRYAQAELMLERLSVLAEHMAPSAASEAREWLNRVQEIQNPKLKAARTFLSKGIDAQTSGRFDQALSFYQKYLRLMPEGPQSVQVRERVEEIQAMLGAMVNVMLKAD